MYMRSPYVDRNLGFDPVSTAIAVYQIGSSLFGGKKKQPGTDYYQSFSTLQPGEYITSTDPTPGHSSVTKELRTTPTAPTATVSPPSPVATLPPSMQPMSAPNYSTMPTLPATTPATTDYIMPILIGSGILLLALSSNKG